MPLGTPWGPFRPGRLSRSLTTLWCSVRVSDPGPIGSVAVMSSLGMISSLGTQKLGKAT